MISLAIACVVLLFLVVIVTLRPLLRAGSTPLARGQFDRAVYRDQLAEIDADLARGAIGAKEAEAARLEIQRRLIAVPDAPAASPVPVFRSTRLAGVLAVLLAGSAGGLYWQLGAPALTDASPMVAQASAAEANAPLPPAGHSDFRAAAEKLQQKLAADPNDAESWELYARTESRLGDWQRSADAYHRAIDLGRKDAGVLAGYGEMLVLGAQGVVLPPARDAFKQALVAGPGNEIARFYLALADSQAGEARKAVDEWVDLAGVLAEDDPMREEIANRIAAASRSGGFEPPKLPAAPPVAATDAHNGPTEAQMAKAAKMSPEDRDKMVAAMVDQLAAKLKANPNDADGWLRLANAYGISGKYDQATDAFDHAAALRPDDPTIKLESAATIIARLDPSDPIPPKAVTLLHEVSAVAPDAPEVLWYLGVVAAREGRRDEARGNWTRLLAKLDSGSEDYRTVQKALAELKTE